MPEISRRGKSGSALRFTINELPIEFCSPGFHYYDCIDSHLRTDVEINDSIEITVLEYEYRNGYLENKNSLFGHSLEYLGLVYKGKEYVNKNSLIIEPPNLFNEFIIKAIICIVIIVVGYYKLIDTY